MDPKAPNAAGSEAPPLANLTDAKGARAVIYSVPKKSPDTIYVGLNDRDAAWHDVYKVKISTGERELVRKNTERIAGWDFDLEGRLRLATRFADSGDTEILASSPTGFKKVYSCTRLRDLRHGPLPQGRQARLHGDEQGRRRPHPPRAVRSRDGQEELVETDPENRVDFGSAIFSDATDELVGDVLRGQADRALLPRPGWEADYKVLQGKFPGQDIELGSSTDDERLMLITVAQRHRSRRALPLRPRQQEAGAPVQRAREAPARAPGEHEGRFATSPRTASRSRPT